MSKAAIFYILGISVLWGVIFPDFRFSITSIVLIQLVYPVLVCIPFTIISFRWPIYLHAAVFVSFGVFLNTVVSVIVFTNLYGGSLSTDNNLSSSIYIGSTVAKLLIVLVLAIIIIFVRKKDKTGKGV